MGAGMFLSAYGQYQANRDEADAEQQNAEFFFEQAKHAEESARREESIYRQESEENFGNQVSSFAKAGVDISGSPLMMLAGARANNAEEVNAIRAEGAIRTRLAYMRGASAENKANTLRSTKYNLLQAGGTFLTGGGRMLASSGQGD